MTVGVIAALVIALILSLFKPAYADATEYPGGTFTYGGLTYPTSLYGVQVTFNTNPNRPDDYIGLAGGPIMWNSGGWYPIAGLTSNGIVDYWLSEKYAGVSNPWYIAWNGNQSTVMTNGGNFFDANHGWYGSNRTITFGYGSDASYPVGSMHAQTTLKLLYHHDFIRYVVDNSDFRTRYTFGTTPSNPTIGSMSASVGYFGTTSITMQRGIRVRGTAPYPSTCQFWFSTDNSNWQLLGTLTSPTASNSDSAEWFWTTTRSGYFQVRAFMPNASAASWTWTSDFETYDPEDDPTIGGGESGDDSTGDMVQSAIDTLRSIYNGFRAFFDGLLGWLPADLRNFFVAIVVCSLVIGLFRIIRGS